MRAARMRRARQTLSKVLQRRPAATASPSKPDHRRRSLCALQRSLTLVFVIATELACSPRQRECISIRRLMEEM
jgi:hypothetical protein